MVAGRHTAAGNDAFGFAKRHRDDAMKVLRAFKGVVKGSREADHMRNFGHHRKGVGGLGV